MHGIASSWPLAGLAFALTAMVPAVREGDRAAHPAASSAFAVRADAAPATAETSHRIRRARDGLFYVTAEVNGAPIRFLVDTGASVAVLTSADARRVGARPGSAAGSGSVATVGGTVRIAWTTLDSIRIGPHRFRNERAAIVRDGPGVSLIGQSLLSQFASIRIEGDTLQLM